MAPKSRPDLAPLGVKCSSTECTIGLHYFGPAWRKRSKYPIGLCKDCGIELVDWKRVHERQTGNLDYLLDMLQRECWRHEWWHRQIDLVAMNHARRKGRSGLIVAAKAILERSICPQHHPRQGRQTPTKDNVVYYAQHATGTCCRRCLDYWHGIAQDREISQEDVKYLVDVIMRYVDIRLPALNQNPEHVASIDWQAAEQMIATSDSSHPRP